MLERQPIFTSFFFICWYVNFLHDFLFSFLVLLQFPKYPFTLFTCLNLPIPSTIISNSFCINLTPHNAPQITEFHYFSVSLRPPSFPVINFIKLSSLCHDYNPTSTLQSPGPQPAQIRFLTVGKVPCVLCNIHAVTKSFITCNHFITCKMMM